MILSRAKPVQLEHENAPVESASSYKRKVPRLEDFIENRDYTGAIALLKFSLASGKRDKEYSYWLAYAAFHLGDYKKAITVYRLLLSQPDAPPTLHVYLAACYFFCGKYKESDEEAQKAPTSKLQNRLLFHLSHKFNDEKRLMGYHQNLMDIIEDQLTLASIHYLRNHYQEAIDIHKKLLADNPAFRAFNVYIAMCYYKLEYYDVSQEVLSVYLQEHHNSVIATNLKACNHFRLFNGKAAEAELKSLAPTDNHQIVPFAQDLIDHNLVVFRGGEGAMQVLPPLVDVIPEARLNLVIYHIKNDDVMAAFQLMKDVEPSTPQEYILKGVVNAIVGQEQDSKEHLKIAQQYFQLVGSSPSQCDSISGRQSMCSCFFLLKQFEDVLVYLNSIKSYFYNDDGFNYNFGQAKVATKAYEEAEEALLLVRDEKILKEFTYLSHLAKCYIMNGKPMSAWGLYLKMETSTESLSLLQLIAHDCYKMKQYIYSAKAFDILERLDTNQEYWEGKMGACVGAFRAVTQGTESRDVLRDILNMLRHPDDPQGNYIVRAIKSIPIHLIQYNGKQLHISQRASKDR